MSVFTAILLSFNLALQVCMPVGASYHQAQELNGIELAFKEAGIPLKRYLGCKKVEIKLPSGETISPDDLLPTWKEEANELANLISKQHVAIIYRRDFKGLAKMVEETIRNKGISVVLTYSYPKEKKNFLDLLERLIDLKDNKKIHINSVVFLGTYKEAVLIMPFFRIFRPFPKVAATWRIYHPLLFAYRSFLETTTYYEWFPSWLPIITIRGFIINYIKTYKHPPTRFAALGYDAAQMAIYAVRNDVKIEKAKVNRITANYLKVNIKNLPKLVPPVADAYN